MKLALYIFFAFTSSVLASFPIIDQSTSPDGQMYAVMDIDRDKKLSPEWKEDSFPQIEIIEKKTSKILASIPYFGSPNDDKRPLREHVVVSWRQDSNAFTVTVNDRFYSATNIYIRHEGDKFKAIPPLESDYKKLTGFPFPDTKHLRARGRNTILGWNEKGHLIYEFFLSPLSTYQGKDPLHHTIHLEVHPDKLTVIKVVREEGEWRNGDWVPSKPNAN